MKQLFISFVVILSVSHSFGATCSSILAESPLQTAPTSKPENYLSALEILQEIEKEAHVLNSLSENTAAHLKAMRRNQKLRSARGGYSNTLDAQRAMKISQVKSALRDGDIGRLWELVDMVMLKTEYYAVKVNAQRKKINALENVLSQGVMKNGLLKHFNMYTQLHDLKQFLHRDLLHLHSDYTLYRAFRKTFENQITNGRSDKDKSFAEYALSKTGLQNSALVAKYPKYSDIENGTRPSVDFIRNEYLGLDFEDGSTRFYSGQGLYFKLKMENKALTSIKYRGWVRLAGFHKTIDILAQKVRKYSYTKISKAVANALDWIVRDLQNQEALMSHLAEIDSIYKIRPSRQMKRFQVILTNFKNGSLVADKEFDFLTSFARSQEYKLLWTKVHLSLALQHFASTSLIDTLITLERDLSIASAELDLVQVEIQEKGTRLGINTGNLQQEDELITVKKEKEDALDAHKKTIEEKLSEFLELKPSEAELITSPSLLADQVLFRTMQKANERADSMGPLSYDYSPGTSARLSAYTIAVIAGGRHVVINSPAIEYIDAFLLKHLGVTIPEMSTIWGWGESLITNIQPYIQSINSTI